MSIHRLVALLGRALATCCARLHPLVIVPLRAFLPAPLTYDLACLHSEWYCQREASRGERIIHYLEEFLYRLIIVPLVAFLPAPLAYGVACLRGDWCYRHETFRRERIMRSLACVFGDRLSPAERAHVTRDFFRRYSCEVMDVMRLAGRGWALARLIEIRGLEHIEAALAGGKGAILCCGHFGLFNGGFSLIGTCGFPITAVGNWRSRTDPNMSPLQRAIWRLTHEKRVARHRRSNIEPQEEGFGVAIRIMETLRSNEVIAMPIDVPTPAADHVRAVAVDFLDHQTLLLPGCAEIAQLTDSPILVSVMRRQPDWRHQILEISPLVLPDSDTVKTFKRCMAMVEAPIRQNPAHWNFWESPQDLADLGLLPTERQH